MRPLHSSRLAVLFLGLGLCALVPAQDPPRPPGGFGSVEIADTTISWSDGFLTLMNVFRPAAAAPPGGWPGIMVIHGGSGSRNNAGIRTICQVLADAGYVAAAYDVRGDGVTLALNPAAPPPTSERTMFDLAESFGEAAAVVPGLMDLNRLGVTGQSQGGFHSIEAAVRSGLVLPPGSGLVTFPVIGAIVPEIATTDHLEDSLSGTIVNGGMPENLFQSDPLHPYLALLAAGDYLTLRTLESSNPYLNKLPGLQLSTVPMLFMAGWQDYKHHVIATMEADATLNPAQLRRYFLTTGGHSTPENTGERRLLHDYRRRWFDRFLKGFLNGVETEPLVNAAVLPPNAAGYQSASTAWRHRYFHAWPPANGVTLHLRGGGALTAAAPAAIEAGPVVNHTVAAGYDVYDFAAAGPFAVGGLTASIPMDSEAFLGAPLTAAVEIIGRPRVALTVDSSTGTFQLHAALFHRSASGTDTFITSNAGALRNLAPGRHTLTIDLNDTAMLVPGGHRLVLRIENLAIHRPPGSAQKAFFMPEFSSTASTIVIDPAGPSRLELPLLLTPGATMSPALQSVSASAGVAHAMTIEATSAAGTGSYFCFLGASGAWPGTTYAPLPTIAVNEDAWTTLGLVAFLYPIPELPGLSGTLDASGRGTASVLLTPGVAAALVGYRFTFAALVLDGADVLASGPAELIIEP